MGQSFEVFTDELEAITKLFLVDKFCLKIERERGARQDDAETTLCSEVEWIEGVFPRKLMESNEAFLLCQ